MVVMLCWVFKKIFKVIGRVMYIVNIILCHGMLLYNSSGKGACLKDVPAKEEFDVNASRLVGLDFNADKQCKVQFGPAAVFCPLSSAIKVSCCPSDTQLYQYNYHYWVS